MVRAVLDSSVLVSAFLTPNGTSAKLFPLARSGRFIICLSRELIAETIRILVEKRLRLANRYRYDADRIQRFERHLMALAEVVGELPKLRVVPVDPADDKIVATAVAAGADFLVAGDRHLLALGQYGAIRILTPRQFLDMLTEP
jgi:putative PIN family toxin of toxin-antitoxin system